MRGNGTQASPYIITTAAELYSMETVGGSGVYFRLGADIDLNGTQWAEHFQPIPLNCAGFDGAGHSISNIYHTSVNDIAVMFTVKNNTELRVENILFYNVVLTGTAVNLFAVESGESCDIKLYDCIFSAEIKRTAGDTLLPDLNCLLHGSDIEMDIELCSFALKCDFSYPYSFFKGDKLQRTQVLLDMRLRRSPNIDQEQGAVFYGTDAEDTWICGTLDFLDILAGVRHFHISDRSAKFVNCYEAVGFTGLRSVYWSGSMLSPCFYDSSLLGNADMTSTRNRDPNLYGLTTAQCKDAVYLRSIGFTCGGGEE